MLDTRPIALTDDQANDVRRVLLDQYGKPFYEEKNPHNVAARFTATKHQLEHIIERRPSFAHVHVSVLADIVREIDGTWHPACTLKRLRQFEAIARFARCELQQRNLDPNLFVDGAIVSLSLRLRMYHSTLL